PAAEWESDHAALAMTLLTNGDLERAARLFETIARLPHRPDALMFAGVAWQAHRDSAAAGPRLARGRGPPGLQSRNHPAGGARAARHHAAAHGGGAMSKEPPRAIVRLGACLALALVLGVPACRDESRVPGDALREPVGPSDPFTPRTAALVWPGASNAFL